MNLFKGCRLAESFVKTLLSQIHSLCVPIDKVELVNMRNCQDCARKVEAQRVEGHESSRTTRYHPRSLKVCKGTIDIIRTTHETAKVPIRTTKQCS
jgi:hypothetical protein